MLANFTLIATLILNIFNWFSSAENQIPKDDKIMHSIIKEINDEFNTKYYSSISGIGFGADESGKFNYVNISFEVCQELNLEEARIAMVDLLQKITQQIQTDERIKKYLTPSFNMRNIDLCLHLLSEKCEKLYHPKIRMVTYFKASNSIVYTSKDPDDRYKYYDIAKESYDEALKSIQQSN